MSTTATKSKASGSSKSRAAGSAGKGSKTSAKTKRASAKAKNPAAKSKEASARAKAANKDGGSRLSPGALDGLVIGYMKRSRAKLPATSGVVGRGIKRSPGAIANCLERLEKAGRVRLTNKKPREYDLVVSGSKSN